MKLTFKPQGRLSQKFLENHTSIYKDNGLAGHTGVDWKNGYGHAIFTQNDGVVYKVIKAGQTPSNWAAVYILSEGEGMHMEICYGHVSQALVREGEHVAAGQIIGLEGNSGDVFSGQRRITVAEQKAGSKEGAHCHESWRPVKQEKAVTPGGHYLKRLDGSIYNSANGVYRIMYNNPQTRGHIDPFMYSDTPEKKVGLLKSTISALFALLALKKK